MTEDTLDSVCEFIVDCLHATAPTSEEGFPLIRTPNVGRGRLELNGVFRVSAEIYEKWTRRAVPQNNDLILAREAPAGNVAIIKNDEKVCLGQRTVHLRPNVQKVDPDFLCYFLLAPSQQGKLLAPATGATAPHVNMKDIRNLPLIGLPKRDVQTKIGFCLSYYDDLIQNNLSRIELFERIACTLFDEWFIRLKFPGYEHTKIIDGIPDKWKIKTLRDLATLNYGKSLKDDIRISGKYPVFGSSGIVGWHNEFYAKGPGIVIGRKGNVGSIFIASTNYWPIDTVFFISSDQFSYFLYHSLLTKSFINSDGAVPGLNREWAYRLPILFPEEKYRMEFESFVTPIHTQIRLLQYQNEKLRIARDLLLPKLMSGEIIV